MSSLMSFRLELQLQPVLSSMDLQLSPPPPPSPPSSHSMRGRPPLCPPATLLIPPRSFLVLQGVEGVTDKRHLLQQAENGRWGRLRAMWPDAGHVRPTKKTRSGEDSQGGEANTSSAQWQFMRGREKKKSNLHCFNPQGRLHSHGALTQQLVRKRSCKLTPRPSCFLTRRSVHMSLLHMSVTQQKSLINSILPRQRLATSQGCRWRHWKQLRPHLIQFNERALRATGNPGSASYCTSHRDVAKFGSAPSDVDTVPRRFCFRLSRTWSHWMEGAGKPGQRPTGVLCSLEQWCCDWAQEPECRWIQQMLLTPKTSWIFGSSVHVIINLHLSHHL